MIKSYLGNMQIRLQLIENCIGGIDNYKEQRIKQIKSTTSQYISKLHKDTQRRFQKIKKTIEKYNDVLDMTTLKDKILIISEEVEELKQIQLHLDNIQKNLPALNTQKYAQIKSNTHNIHYLLTASQIQYNPNNNHNQFTISKFQQKSLTKLRDQHRQQINQLFQLNKRIVNNLNNKIELLLRKKGKSS